MMMVLVLLVGPSCRWWSALGEDAIIRTNPNTIQEDITVGATANNDAKFTNGMSAGPITIGNGYTVTMKVVHLGGSNGKYCICG